MAILYKSKCFTGKNCKKKGAHFFRLRRIKFALLYILAFVNIFRPFWAASAYAFRRRLTKKRRCGMINFTKAAKNGFPQNGALNCRRGGGEILR